MQPNQRKKWMDFVPEAELHAIASSRAPLTSANAISAPSLPSISAIAPPYVGFLDARDLLFSLAFDNARILARGAEVFGIRVARARLEPLGCESH
jgi:hypothetical protein